MCWEGAGPQGPTPWKQSRWGARGAAPAALQDETSVQTAPFHASWEGIRTCFSVTGPNAGHGKLKRSVSGGKGEPRRRSDLMTDLSRPVLSEGYDVFSVGRKEPAGGDAVKDLALASWSHFKAHCTLPTGPLMCKTWRTNRL